MAELPKLEPVAATGLDDSIARLQAIGREPCPGVEVAPGAWSGCDAETTGEADCPTCGDPEPEQYTATLRVTLWADDADDAHAAAGHAAWAAQQANLTGYALKVSYGGDADLCSAIDAARAQFQSAPTPPNLPRHEELHGLTAEQAIDVVRTLARVVSNTDKGIHVWSDGDMFDADGGHFGCSGPCSCRQNGVYPQPLCVEAMDCSHPDHAAKWDAVLAAHVRRALRATPSPVLKEQ